MKNLIVFIGLAFSIVIVGQEDIIITKTNKGKIFFYWGWNRGYFSNSDIHFSGEGSVRGIMKFLQQILSDN